jgi:hypothetical protein
MPVEFNENGHRYFVQFFNLDAARNGLGREVADALFESNPKNYYLLNPEEIPGSGSVLLQYDEEISGSAFRFWQNNEEKSAPAFGFLPNEEEISPSGRIEPLSDEENPLPAFRRLQSDEIMGVSYMQVNQNDGPSLVYS